MPSGHCAEHRPGAWCRIDEGCGWVLLVAKCEERGVKEALDVSGSETVARATMLRLWVWLWAWSSRMDRGEGWRGCVDSRRKGVSLQGRREVELRAKRERITNEVRWTHRAGTIGT